jgi:hypothetical protein
MFIVYKTINMVNDKYYVGVHNNANPNYLGSGTALCLAIEKYGKENFKREVLYTFESLDEALRKEAEIVNEEFVRSKETYNLTIGGGMPPILYGNTYKLGKKESEESKLRKRIAFANSEKHKANSKKKKTNTIRQKISESRCGKALGERNAMAKEENRLKVSQSKIGLKRLYKDGEVKMAKPGTDKWNELISKGFR